MFHARKNSVLSLATLLLLLIAFRGTAWRSKSIACCPAPEPVAQASANPTLTDSSAPKPSGEFRFYSHKSNRKRTRIATRRLERNEQVLRDAAAEFADQLNWSQDIDIAFEDCREGSDAFYDDETHKITICREIVDEFYQLFSLERMKSAKLNQKVKGALVSLFFHELSHALIDMFQLPITGREEDAADQLSAILLINRTAHDAAMVLSAAEGFRLLARLERNEQPIYWDEHSLHAQRYYDMVCLVYGSDKQRFAYLVKSGALPEERSEICAEDYERIRKSWTTLLQPYAKNSLWVQK